MIAKDLLKKISAHKGALMVEIANFDDVFWVQAVKGDIYRSIKEAFDPDQETGFELDDEGFLGKDFLTQ